MNDVWLPAETTTHQDHVIAHVIGTSVLGHFVIQEAVHLLLDIGFIWKIYVDGEMGLLPHPVAVVELGVDEGVRTRIKADIDLLLRDGRSAAPLGRLSAFTVDCLINEVAVFVNGDERRLLLLGEEADLEIETSITSDGFRFTETPKCK